MQPRIESLLKRLYLEDKSRQQAMREAGITNTNSMSGISSKLGLHWSWPLENRKSGQKPMSSYSRKNRPRVARVLLGGLCQPEEQETSPISQAEAIAETVVARRNYGPSTMLSARAKRGRAVQDSDFNIGGDMSPYPKPTKDCPYDIITYFAKHVYEKKSVS